MELGAETNLCFCITYGPDFTYIDVTFQVSWKSDLKLESYKDFISRVVIWLFLKNHEIYVIACFYQILPRILPKKKKRYFENIFKNEIKRVCKYYRSPRQLLYLARLSEFSSRSQKIFRFCLHKNLPRTKP